MMMTVLTNMALHLIMVVLLPMIMEDIVAGMHSAKENMVQTTTMMILTMHVMRTMFQAVILLIQMYALLHIHQTWIVERLDIQTLEL